MIIFFPIFHNEEENSGDDNDDDGDATRRSRWNYVVVLKL